MRSRTNACGACSRLTRSLISPPTFAGGLQRRSVKVTISDGYTDEQGVNYMALATVRVPVFDRDNTT